METEAVSKLSALQEKFRNQLIGGGVSGVRDKWKNLSSLENDEDKKFWTVGPVQKGGLIGIGFEKKVDDAAFALKKGEISDIVETFTGVTIMFRVE